MGDSSLASFLKTGFGVAMVQLALGQLAKLKPIVGKEISAICNVEDELQKLRTTSSKIKELVDDVDSILLMIYGGSNAVLFKKLQKLDYEADDLLDYVSLHLSDYCARHSITSNNQERHLRSMVLSSFRKFNLPHKIAGMHQKLDVLAKEAESSMGKRTKFDADISGRSSQMSSYSFIEQSSVVGRDEDKDCIVSLLHENDGTSTTTNFSVISILGMRGIGKTTVAHLAYDAVNFEKKIWVPLSGDFDTINITKFIIDVATRSACNLSDLGSLQLRLQEILSECKFLIVLDDYCSENRDDWVTLTRPFQYGSHGSKVIVTTTNMKASRTAVRANEECILELLSDNDCWEIIKKSAVMSSELSQDLNSLGMQIAKKCQGLPQVANTLGNMLYGKSTEQEWRHVLERDMLDLLQDNNILFHLVQSYAHLPPHLQKCFAYCSIFPQGYEFEIEELIFLWMAEGFIQPAQYFKELGRDYFNELYLRFFFHQCRTPSNQIRYKIHDLIHGMIRLVYKNICFHAKHYQSKPYALFGDACHLSLLHDDIQSLELKESVENEGLRTFLVMRSSSSSNATTILDPELFSHLKFLKVLGLGGVGLTELVDSIGLLECLRYLNLSDNPISSLPKSVCKIFALQILKLRNCDYLRDLPEEMSNLINLIHLEFNERMFTGSGMPPHFRKLVKLQYLSAYTVRKKNGCGIGELNSLNCLGGELCIRKIEVSNKSEAKEAMLDLKTHLDTLKLVWKSPDQYDPLKSLEQARVFVELRPHLNLKKLVINSYFGLTYPPWLSDPSHNFTSIDLNGLKYCGNLPSLGELPKLTSFSISDMPCLVLIDHTFYGAMKFPSLKSFQLRGLSNLTHWEEAHGNGNVMPRLHVFTLNDCQELSRLPENLQALLPVSTVSGCPRLQP